MDFDMYWVDVPSEDVRCADAALGRLQVVDAETRAELGAIGSTWHPEWSQGGPPTQAERELWMRRHAAYEACLQARYYWFGLSNSAMRHVRQVMHESGMAVPSQPPTDWPDPADYGPAVEEWTGHHRLRATCRLPLTGVPALPELTAYLDDRAAYLRARGTDQDGIPLHKLSSTNGWHVTPHEIEPALRRAPEVAMGLDEHGRHGPAGWWLPWLEYMRQATSHDGFEVW